MKALYSAILTYLLLGCLIWGLASIVQMGCATKPEPCVEIDLREFQTPEEPSMHHMVIPCDVVAGGLLTVKFHEEYPMAIVYVQRDAGMDIHVIKEDK